MDLPKALQRMNKTKDPPTQYSYVGYVNICQPKKPLEAPRTCLAQVGSQSISPLLVSIESGNMEAAKVGNFWQPETHKG